MSQPATSSEVTRNRLLDQSDRRRVADQLRLPPSYERRGAPINSRFFGVISAGMDCVQTR